MSQLYCTQMITNAIILPTNWIGVKKEHWCSEYSTKHLVVEQAWGPQDKHKKQDCASETEQYHNPSHSSIHTNTLLGGQVAPRGSGVAQACSPVWWIIQWLLELHNIHKSIIDTGHPNETQTLTVPQNSQYTLYTVLQKVLKSLQ